MNPHLITRRKFLATAASAGAAIAGAPALIAGIVKAAGGEIPKRPLGRTGVKVSMLGVGGYHIGIQKDPAESTRIMHAAIDAGVTFFDNAWEYNKGESEKRMGDAIHDRRDKVFLMTKVCARDAKGAMENLEDSLRRLRTDHLDLWQFHEINYKDDPEMVFAKGGAIEAAVAAKKQGKVRFIGFTGHKSPDFHLKMLAQDFAWDAVQMPVNVLDAHYRSFQKNVLPVLAKRGIGIIAMKTMGGGGARMISDGVVTARDALRFVFNLPVSTVLSGMKSLDDLKQNVETARHFQPLDAQEVRTLLERTASAAADGRYELFKSSQGFDGRIHRQQHGVS
jgi:aryl-alcohol dehydrogenase-like predicted oxidoreductase